MSTRALCRYRGELAVPEEGRWFVYAEFDAPDGRRETWLPVDVANGATVSGTHDLYVPPSKTDRSSEVVIGGLLLVAAATVLTGSVRAVMRDPARSKARVASPTAPG